MSTIDWVVMVLTLAGITGYGVYKGSRKKNLESYFLSNRSMPWWIVLLGIMGTQASAITFISAPGQAFTDGMRFVQYYFGLPIAMVVVSAVFIPIFQRLRVYTAYEYLEGRFDRKTRLLAALLFLIGRGLSTGISIYAPAIIFSALLGVNIYWMILLMGGVLIIYTVTGGAKSVAYTQQLQVMIMLGGMALAGYMAVYLLPEGIGLTDALRLGGSAGKMNVITSGKSNGGFDWQDRYNIWSGIIGGFFLALSYFGTDQSQVGRYLVAKNQRESRLGLIMNGLVKVPMQFLILGIGVLVFAFYQYRPAPVFYNQTLVQEAMQTPYAGELQALEQRHTYWQQQWQSSISQRGTNLVAPLAFSDSLRQIRSAYTAVLGKAVPGEALNDTNYIFLYFITHHLPPGLVGLLLAAIVMAAWGSIAAALNALASCTVIDFHLPLLGRKPEEQGSYHLGWKYTLAWGVFCIGVAMFATNMGSLIEAVNVLGSLFYGVILGIFLVAFFLPKVGGHAVFWAAVVSEIVVIAIYQSDAISFLWLNAIGALVLMFFALLLQPFSHFWDKRHRI